MLVVAPQEVEERKRKDIATRKRSLEEEEEGDEREEPQRKKIKSDPDLMGRNEMWVLMFSHDFNEL